MIDLLTCGFVFGWLAIGETLGGRYVALDREDRELVVARNAVTGVVAVRDQTDRAGDEEEQRREDRRRSTRPPRALARRVRTARQRRSAPGHQLEADRDGLSHRAGRRCGRRADRFADPRASSPD